METDLDPVLHVHGVLALNKLDHCWDPCQSGDTKCVDLDLREHALHLEACLARDTLGQVGDDRCCVRLRSRASRECILTSHVDGDSKQHKRVNGREVRIHAEQDYEEVVALIQGEEGQSTSTPQTNIQQPA